MIRKKIIAASVPINNPNYMINMDDVLETTIKSLLNGKTMSNYVVLDSKIIGKGYAFRSESRGTIAEVNVKLELTVLVVPDHAILEKCMFIKQVETDEANDQTYYQFSLVSDELSKELIDKIIIFVGSNGLKATSIRKLKDLQPGDVIQLFVISSNAYPHINGIACMSTPEVDGINVVFKFTNKMIETGKFDQFSSKKLVADKLYTVQNKRIIEVYNASVSSIIDFLDIDQLEKYISMLVSL